MTKRRRRRNGTLKVTTRILVAAFALLACRICHGQNADVDFYKTAAVASEELRDIRLAVEGYIEAFGRAPSLHYATFFRQLSGHNPKGEKYLDSAFFKKNRWGGVCVDGNGRKYLISKRGGTLVVASRSYAELSVRISLPQAQAVRTPLTELEKACFVGIVEIDVSEGKSIALIEKLRERCKRDGR